MDNINCAQQKNCTSRQSTLIARNFFKKHGELLLYDHSRQVLQRAIQVGMVRPQLLNKPGPDQELARMHYIISQVLLYHTLESDAIMDTKIVLPQPLQFVDVRDELNKFCLMTKVIRHGESVSELIPLLNNDRPPLALPAVLVDMAVTHVTESETYRFINKDHDPLFRYYASDAEAQRVMRNSARFGESLLPQLAELLGYPSLAGDILEDAHHINHPVIYKFIKARLADVGLQERLRNTQLIVKSLRHAFRESLKSMGIEATVELRLHKHPGKQMKKLANMMMALEKNGVDSDAQQDIQRDSLLSFDISKRFNDLVALRVIVHKCNGHDVDKMSTKQLMKIMKNINDLLLVLTKTKMNIGAFGRYSIDSKFKATARGYTSFHDDVYPTSDGLSNFEIQLRTTAWHEVAEYGKAAHYLYVSDYVHRDEVEMIRTAYGKIIHAFENGSKSH
ncbi:MAG: hypothetical protein V1492_03165 [Candidatus Micrarchaeota archaeon]